MTTQQPMGFHDYKAGYGPLDPLSHAVSQRDNQVMDMVKEALDLNRGALAYQPVMKSQNTKQVAFFEGLIRLSDGTGLIIPAKEFIEVVEDMELGRRIDCLALELGLRSLVAEPKLRLSINMSARSIGYRKWMQTLEQGLAGHEHIADRLILEITETSAMSMPELVISFMKDMQKRGISFALDDFGAGQTSFRYLRDFFFDILKIDGQFTKNLAQNPDNQVLMQALGSIANHFEMFTVAENVESAEDAQLLIAMGIDCLQGYHFGAPSVTPPWAHKSAR
ncbi:MAG: EAL domain-containing protein [Pseudomonadota bacterium]